MKFPGDKKIYVLTVIGLGVPGFKLVQILAAYFMLCTDLKYIIPVHKACTMYAHWLIINFVHDFIWDLNYGYFDEPNPGDTKYRCG